MGSSDLPKRAMRRGACFAAVRWACAVVNETPERFSRYFRTKGKSADRRAKSPALQKAKRAAERALALAASSSRFLGAAVVSSARSSLPEQAAISSIASAKAASLAFDGLLKPVIFRTNCSEAARTSSGVTGGSKLKRFLLFLHMGCSAWPFEALWLIGLETSLALRNFSNQRCSETVDKSDAISCHARYPRGASNPASRASIHLLQIHCFSALLLQPLAPGRIL